MIELCRKKKRSYEDGKRKYEFKFEEGGGEEISHPDPSLSISS